MPRLGRQSAIRLRDVSSGKRYLQDDRDRLNESATERAREADSAQTQRRQVRGQCCASLMARAIGLTFGRTSSVAADCVYTHSSRKRLSRSSGISACRPRSPRRVALGETSRPGWWGRRFSVFKSCSSGSCLTTAGRCVGAVRPVRRHTPRRPFAFDNPWRRVIIGQHRR
jgi:hypothetical protein